MTVSKVYTSLTNDGFIQIDRKHGAKASLHFPDNDVFTKELTKELSILSAESSLRGLTKENFLNLCEIVFETNDISKNGGNQ